MLVSSHRNRSGPPASFFPMHLQKKLHRPHIGDAAEVCLNKKNLLRRYEGTNEGANLLPSTYLRWYINMRVQINLFTTKVCTNAGTNSLLPRYIATYLRT